MISFVLSLERRWRVFLAKSRKYQMIAGQNSKIKTKNLMLFSTLQHFTGKKKICHMLEIKSMEKGDIHFR
jgi:hypothetical protein